MGMLWLQTHFDDEHWDELSRGLVALSQGCSESLIADALEAGLKVNRIPSLHRQHSSKRTASTAKLNWQGITSTPASIASRNSSRNADRRYRRAQNASHQSAHAGNQHRSGIRQNMHQFLEVFLTALGHRVGEEG